MPYPVKKRAAGAPPNVLRKKSSITAGEATNYSEQPWATAHLHQRIPGAVARESPAVEASRSSDKISAASTSDRINTNNRNNNNASTMATEEIDAITPLSTRQVFIDPIAGHSNVTVPARPARKHTISECFDLDDIAPGSSVRSPSGNLLSAGQAAVRPDRPIGIKERQEAIRRKVAEHRELGLGNEVSIVGNFEGKAKEREAKENREKIKKKAKDMLKCGCVGAGSESEA